MQLNILISKTFRFIFVIPTLLLYSQVSITDITQTNLIGDAYNNGLYGGHGVMFCDVDGDGDPDMYITMNNNEEMPDQFFENNGLGVFTEKALEKGIENNDIKGSHGWVWADLDNDGDYDGWNGSYTKNIPYRNKNDQPSYFDDMFSVSGIEDINLGTRGVAAFDFDKDGDLDLFGNNWYARDSLQENEFYRNDGNFTFTRIDNGLTNAKGDQGICDGDFDNDGDIDLILSVFEGNKDGRCVEIMENVEGQFIKLENSGLNLCNASFNGVTFWDMNNDGWLDVITADRILINNKNKTFTEAYQLPEVSNDVMTGIADLNNDGYWDLVSPGLDKVYINNGNLTFTTVSMTTGPINDPRCVSFADIDGDGDVDFALAQKKIYNRLYRNDYSGTNRYLKVSLRTKDNQIGAFGAKVYLYSTEGDTLLSYREAHSNQGYLAQDDPILHFGCGSRDSVKVKVVFLNGQIHEFITETNKLISVPASIKIKVYLEGSYVSNSMNTNIESSISHLQPYSSVPWEYSGGEEIDAAFLAEYDIVDWILLEARLSSTSTSPDNIVGRRAVLLKSDGNLIDTNGSETIYFWGTPPGNYFLTIKHRNHLSVMSSSVIDMTK